MILIHPPVSKPCEPPAGIARLCGALNHHGMNYTVLDANIEGLLFLLNSSPGSSDTWTIRALRHLSGHLDSIRSVKAYKKEDRYRRAMNDLNRLLKMAANGRDVHLSLTNYEDKTLSPIRSTDLIRAAENFKANLFYPYFKKRLPDLLKERSPSLVGFSLNYLSQALSTFAMIGFLRREYPKAKIVLGGGLVTSWMRRPHWKNPFQGWVDHLVSGSGETALLSLLNGSVFSDIHCPPHYDSFPIKEYIAPGFILPYSASTGCYWNQCSFCPEKAEENPYHAIPPDKVIADLHLLVQKHQPVLIHLLDNALAPSVMQTLSMHSLGVPWYGFARITRHLTDLEFCYALKQSGCAMLQLGLESGDQGVLDSLQKGIHLEEASLVLSNLKKAGIATYVYLLFGTPSEGAEEARRTLGFVIKHHESIDFLNLAIFNMPIYGPEVELLKTEVFYEGDLSLYTGFDHPKGWNRPLVRQFLDKEFKRHPAIASMIRRDPPVFTSNHAPFFTKAGRMRGWDE